MEREMPQIPCSRGLNERGRQGSARAAAVPEGRGWYLVAQSHRNWRPIFTRAYGTDVMRLVHFDPHAKLAQVFSSS